MNKEYQELYGQLKAPEEWKSAIKAQMKEAVLQEQIQQENTKKKSKKSNKIIFAFGGLAAGAGTIAAAAMLGIVVLVTLNSSSIYKQPMKDGVYYDEVALKQGDVYFNEEDDYFLDLGLSLGQGDAQTPIKTEETIAVGEGTVKITTVDGAKMPAKDGRMSEIRDTEVFVSSDETENGRTFKASFEKGGKLYTLESEQVSQKDFIDFLYKKLR